MKPYQIELKTLMVGPDRNWQPGKILNVPGQISDAEAKDLVAGRYAVVVKEQPAPAPEAKQEEAPEVETAEAPPPDETAEKPKPSARKNPPRPKARSSKGK